MLPDGIDIEVLKTGGLGGMYFSIDRARFIQRQLLAAPRLAPLIERWRRKSRASCCTREHSTAPKSPSRDGEIPSLTSAVGGMPACCRFVDRRRC